MKARHFFNTSNHLNILLFYPIVFLVLYLEPLYLGGVTFGVIWKMVFLAYMLVIIGYKLSPSTRIDLFVVFAILLSLKYFVSISAYNDIFITVSQSAKVLMLPMIYLWSLFRLKETQLVFLAKHISILIVLSFLPFILGFLEPLGEGYELDKYGLDGVRGLVGLFQGPHSASISVTFSLLVLTYFLFLEKTIRYRFLYVALIGLGLYELVFIFVRTGYMAFLVGVVFLAFHMHVGRKRFVYGVGILIVIAYGASYVYENNETIYMRMNDTSIYQERAAARGSGRLVMAKSAIENWQEEGAVSVFIGQGSELASDNMEEKLGIGFVAHNGYIQILQTQGIIGLTLYLGFLYYLLKLLFNRRRSAYYPILGSLILCYMATMLFQGGFWFTSVLPLAVFAALLKRDGYQDSGRPMSALQSYPVRYVNSGTR